MKLFFCRTGVVCAWAWLLSSGISFGKTASVKTFRTWDAAVRSSGRLLPEIDPKKIEGLKLWLRPDGLTATHGKTISKWEDQGPQGSHAVSRLRGAPEILANAINGLPAANFAANTQLYLPNNSVFDIVADFDIFFVIQPQVFQGYHSVLCGGGGGDNPLFGLQGANWTIYSSGLSPISMSSTKPAVLNTWYVTEFLKEVNDVVFTASGEPAGTGTFSIPAAAISDPYRGIGCGSAADECFTGLLAEVIYFDHALSDPERVALTCDLGRKYGIAVRGCR